MTKTDGRPLREQIAADLRAWILDGKFPTVFPGIEVLAAWFDTSMNTVQHALEILKAEGLITAEKGRKTRVTAPAKMAVVADPDPQLNAYRYEFVDVSTLDAPGWVRPKADQIEARDPETVPADVVRALELDGGRAVRRLRIMRRRDTGAPVELSWSYYPAGVAEGTRLAEPGAIKGGTQPILDAMGLPVVDFEDRVTTRPPTTQELELLELPEFTAVLRTLRIVWSHDRKPIEAIVMIKGGHLFELLYSRSAH